MNILHEFFNSKSDTNQFLEASEQEQLENDFEEWYDQQCKDFSFVALPLIKHIVENHHPHVKCLVDSEAAELLEGHKVLKTHEYIVD